MFFGAPLQDLPKQPLSTMHFLPPQSAVNFEVTSDLGGRPHLHIPLRDDEGDSLLPHLPAAIAFIQEGMQGGGKVLVHCQAGRSRSVALAVAYLMKSQGLGAQEVRDRKQYSPCCKTRFSSLGLANACGPC